MPVDLFLLPQKIVFRLKQNCALGKLGFVPVNKLRRGQTKVEGKTTYATKNEDHRDDNKKDHNRATAENDRGLAVVELFRKVSGGE